MIITSKMKNILTFFQRARRLFASKTFFYLVVAVFLFSSLWIALSARYPMAFDENYHYKIIQQYSHQYSPFFTHPPAASEALGDITRYPSYLYHYLLSFVYRGLSLLGFADTTKIILLRLLNSIIFGSSLFVFKEIFKKMHLSPTVINVSLLFFVLTPVVPFLAAHINYDNLLVPLSAVAVLLAIKLIECLQKGKFPFVVTVELLVTCFITSLVKFNFLPIFLAIGLVCLVELIKTQKKQKIQFTEQLKTQLSATNRYVSVSLGVLLVLFMGLFVERYGVNIIKYHTPTPECSQILSVASCSQYGPWARDNQLKMAKTGDPEWGALRYSGHWLAQNMHELFFAIDQNYVETSPLPMPYYAGWVFGFTGLVLIVLYARRLKAVPYASLIAVITMLYTAILWADNFHRFNIVNWPVAIHGRYLLPILIFIYAAIAQSFFYALTGHSGKTARLLRLMFPALAIVCMLQGGIVTYVIRSNQNWYWTNAAVIRVNNGLRALLNFVVIK